MQLKVNTNKILVEAAMLAYLIMISLNKIKHVIKFNLLTFNRDLKIIFNKNQNKCKISLFYA